MSLTKFDSFDVTKLQFGKAEERRYGTKRIAIKYDDHALLLQTPYMSNKIKFFPRKSEKDSGDSLVMYTDINYADEHTFMNTVMDLNNAVQAHVKDNSKSLFDTKKRGGSVDTMFYDPMTQSGDFNPSFRTNMLINSSNVPIATEFYDISAKQVSYEDFMANMTVDGKFEGRAIIEFTHIYILPDRRYGYKSNVRVVQRADKPEDSKIPGPSGSDPVVSNKAQNIGCSFL